MGCPVLKTGIPGKGDVISKRFAVDRDHGEPAAGIPSIHRSFVGTAEEAMSAYELVLVCFRVDKAFQVWRSVVPVARTDVPTVHVFLSLLSELQRPDSRIDLRGLITERFKVVAK